jgi:DNA-binding transcriptional ArsR family regulator
MHTAAAHADPVDAVFHALSHATRRAVVARLGRGPASVSELAAPFEMALPSFCQHLRVLEGAGVVRSHKRGRVRTYALNPAPLAAGERWLAEQRNLWTARLDQLDALLTSTSELE